MTSRRKFLRAALAAAGLLVGARLLARRAEPRASRDDGDHVFDPFRDRLAVLGEFRRLRLPDGWEFLDFAYVDPRSGTFATALRRRDLAGELVVEVRYAGARSAGELAEWLRRDAARVLARG